MPPVSSPGLGAPASRDRSAGSAQHSALSRVRFRRAVTLLLMTTVVLVLGLRLRRMPSVPRYWLAPFWWSGIAAVAGAVHHAVAVRWTQVAAVSWAVISVLVVVAVSYLLAATVRESDDRASANARRECRDARLPRSTVSIRQT